MSRLLLVSNRLPVTVRRHGGKTSLERSSGGLVAGLGPVHDRGDGLWLGSLGGEVSDKVRAELASQRLVPVALDPKDARAHYEGYSNGVLWPLFHYLLDRVIFDSQDFDAYRRVNERFADVVAEHARPDDRIWVHDYHLLLLPQMLRERLPDATVGFFLHIPFPSSEVFRILPRKEEILRGLLGAHLIGLHTYNFARHLESSFRRVLGVEFDETGWRDGGDPSRVAVFALGVDAARHQELARRPKIDEQIERRRRRVSGRRVILGVDRMDYTKGIPLRLKAFRRLLELHPEWRRNAVLVQLAVPSRTDIESYKSLKDEVDGLVGAINGQFETEGFVPIHYMYRSVPPEELAVLYRAADVMLVTPIRDGMNLVAKEYVASRVDDTGVVVLSEFAGAASEMGEALLHNPWDIDGTAGVLDRALRMSEEEMNGRMRELRLRVSTNNVHHWVTRFLRAFEQARTRQHKARAALHLEHAVAPPDWQTEVLTAFSAAERRAFVLDYDGTLVNLAPTPGAAAPTPEVLELLRRVASLPATQVIVISGRDPLSIGSFMQGLPVHVIAEHGYHWRERGGSEWQELLHLPDMSWRTPVREILEDYTLRSPGSFIEQKVAGLAWHYRQVEPGFGEWQALELAQHLSEAFANSPIEVLHGSKVVEVRPQGFNKGRAYRLIEQRLGPFDFVFAAGDDRTDEDLFAALPPSAWSVKIGKQVTDARFRLKDPLELRGVLRAFGA